MGLYLRGRVFYLRFKYRGHRYDECTGVRASSVPPTAEDRRRATQAARRRRVEIESEAGPPRPGGRPCGLTLETLQALDLARVEDEGLGDVRRRTVDGLWRPLLRLLRPDRDARRLTIGDVAAYTGARRREGARGQTIKREAEALVRTMRIAKRDKMIGSLPFDPDDLPRIRHDPPKQSQRGKLWRLEQVSTVLGKLSKKAVRAGHLDRCRLIMLTGLRLEELHRLDPSWVAPMMRPAGEIVAQLHVPAEAAKWGKARTIPLTAEAAEIIERCAPFARKKPNKSLALASKAAGLPGVLTPRDLRTLFLSLTGATDPVAAQWLGGHTNIATTGLYLKSTEERAIAAVSSAARILGGGTRGGGTASKSRKRKLRKVEVSQ